MTSESGHVYPSGTLDTKRRVLGSAEDSEVQVESTVHQEGGGAGSEVQVESTVHQEGGGAGSS